MAHRPAARNSRLARGCDSLSGEATARTLRRWVKGGTSEVLDRVDAIADVVRDGAAESERLGYLTPAVVDALRDAGLFHMFVQAEFDGLDLRLPESIEVIERVAAFDASTGWTLAILSGGALFTRFLSEDVNATRVASRWGSSPAR